MSEIDVTKRYKPTTAMMLLAAFQNLRDSNPKPMEDLIRAIVREEVQKALHPLPEKHDGKLDNYSSDNHASIGRYVDDGKGRINLFGGYGCYENDSVTLDAKQALSLLAWLQQEEADLQRLAEDKP